MKEQSMKITLTPRQLYPLVQPLLSTANLVFAGESTFWTMGFDQADRLLFVERLVTVRPMHLVPSTVFHTAVSLRAAQVVLCQQPDHQILAPPRRARAMVRRVIHIGLLLQIPLMDHLMLNTRNYLSFMEEGWLSTIAEELFRQKWSSTKAAQRSSSTI